MSIGAVLTAFNNIGWCPMPVLHTVSVIGTRVCFYRKHRDQPAEPSIIPAHPEFGHSTLECWDCDILEDEGET